MAKKGGGGFKGMVASGLVLLLLVGGLVAIARVNHITSIGGLYDFFKKTSDNIWGCGAGELEWKCDTKLPDPSQGGTGGDSTTPGKGGDTAKPTTPGKGDPSQGGTGGTEGRDVAMQALNALTVADAQKVDYQRSQWKHWVGSPCNTREAVLKGQGQGVKVDPSTCKVLSGDWVDPYSNTPFTDPGALDIDHVIPLGYAAAHGGQAWSADMKQQFANDTSQLLAVSAKENRSKSDKGPGDYMPPNRDFRCTYSKMWVSTATKYGVSITKSDKGALEAGLRLCTS